MTPSVLHRAEAKKTVTARSRITIFATAIFVIGCGSGDGPVAMSGVDSGIPVRPAPADPIVGAWTAQVSAICSLGFVFKDDGTYQKNVVCADSSLGRIDLDGERGEFTRDPILGRLHFVVSEATCPDATKRYYYYDLSPDALTLTGSASVTVLVPASGGASSGGTATLGCFRMGLFTPGPYVAIL